MGQNREFHGAKMGQTGAHLCPSASWKSIRTMRANFLVRCAFASCKLTYVQGFVMRSRPRTFNPQVPGSSPGGGTARASGSASGARGVSGVNPSAAPGSVPLGGHGEVAGRVTRPRQDQPRRVLPPSRHGRRRGQPRGRSAEARRSRPGRSDDLRTSGRRRPRTGRGIYRTRTTRTAAPRPRDRHQAANTEVVHRMVCEETHKLRPVIRIRSDGLARDFRGLIAGS